MALFCVSCPWSTVLYLDTMASCKFAILCKRISLALHKQHLQVALKLQVDKTEIIAPS